MKKNLFYVFSAGLITILFTAFAFAQENRRTVSDASRLYVISAKAGGINYVEGNVSVTRKFGKSGLLLKSDALEIGDKVSTGANGKVEILLNPGSFVRLAENSEFEFATTSLEDLQLKLNRGSAMLEVITSNDFTFAVNTPKAKFYIVQSGIYRVDVLADGADKIEVWKGRAQIGSANTTEIKSGKKATVNGSQAIVAKFDRDDKDSLEIFSKSRAREMAKINARLQNTDVRTSLMSSFYRTRWSLYDSYGLWVYSPFQNSYCFLPFGYGWSSPYGYYYQHDIWYYNLPPVIYNSPPPQTTSSPIKAGNGAVLTERTGNQPSRVENQEPIRAIPPYQKIQGEIGREPLTDRQGYSPSYPTSNPNIAPNSIPTSNPNAPAPPRTVPTEIIPQTVKGVN